MFTKIISLLAFAIVGSVDAQIMYLPFDSVTAAWTGTASPVEVGNGVYISPDGALAVVVSKDASVKAFNSLDGTVLWTAGAPSATAQSFGGAFFCYGASQNIIYSYVETSTNVRYEIYMTGLSFLTFVHC
jgi:prepilin signal peptidase PulO-like enzyme (type II secretory pathway)